MFTLLAAFAACSNNAPKTNQASTPSVENVSSDVSTEDSKADEKSIESNNMSTESSDPKASNKVEVTEDEKAVEQVNDGSYITNMLLSKKGERIEDIDAGTTYQIAIEDGNLIVKGTMDYSDGKEDSNGQTNPIEGNEHSFKLADDVIFQAVGGTAKAKMFTQEEFLKYAKEVEDSGLALIIKVENGLVTTVSISS